MLIKCIVLITGLTYKIQVLSLQNYFFDDFLKIIKVQKKKKLLMMMMSHDGCELMI